jgi:hypothetical protein
MAKLTLIGDENKKTPSANTPEDAAAEYFVNRQFMGNSTPKPAISRWRIDQRKRFEKELSRLEKENAAQSELARKQAAARPIGPAQIL